MSGASLVPDYSLFQGSLEAVIVVDDNARILYANPIAINNFTLSEKRIQDRRLKISQIFKDDQVPATLKPEFLSSIKQLGEVYIEDIHLRNGQLEHFMINVNPVESNQTWILHFVPISRQVRLAKQVAEESEARKKTAGQLAEYQNNIELFGLMFIYIVYSFGPLAQKYTVQTMPPILSSAVRLLFAGFLILVFQLLRSKAKIKRKDFGNFMFLGLFARAIPACAMGVALTTVPSGVAGVLLGAQPLLTAAWGMATNRRINPGVAIAMFLGLSSIFLLMLTKGHGAEFNWKYLLPLVSALCATIGSLYRTKEMNPNHICYEFLIGALLGIAGSLFFEDIGNIHFSAFSQASIIGFLFSTVFIGLLASPMQAWIQQMHSPLMASTNTFVQPVMTAALAVLIGGEAFDFRILGAIVLLMAAMTLLFKDRAREKRARSEAGDHKTHEKASKPKDNRAA
jgi:drug/metabolite transporter (DMT)-like permease